ncbi:thioesterase family protein [Citricoccus muralis]|uniref:Thioesterase family protein n=1 Tax=Citricoccus muralis TaxID=169134 RepID=A0ABY8H3F2_9MICC|nr:thioesterase family protein [Citricoccus muralis]WFP15228.1 thioesterase family protein [Citricoccus muralis]
MTDDTAYFRRTAPADTHTSETATRVSLFESTRHAQGTWQEDELHMAPVSGLVVAELEAHEKRDDFVTGRLSFDILGKLHEGKQRVTTRTIRPGRTIELVESTLESGGRTVLRARAWRLQRQKLDPEAILPLPSNLTPVEECVADDRLQQWPGGFIASVQTRVAHDHAAGHGRGWIASGVELIAGETTSSLASLMALADTANGVAPVLPAGKGGYVFPNVDLTLHLVREPVGAWLGLATSTVVGSEGLGINSAELYDERGFFGRSEQLQTVRPVP